jgi:hypothetical protein
MYVMSDNPQFEENGFLIVPNLVQDVSYLFSPLPEQRGMVIYDGTGKIIFSTEDEPQVGGSFSSYRNPIYRELFYETKQKIEKILSMSLEPTYYFDRFYFQGQSLSPHVDRESCEVSVSIQLSTNAQTLWPLWFKKPDGTYDCVTLKSGDGVIYKGCEIEHWRDPLGSDAIVDEEFFVKGKIYHHQIFLHYVNADGPYLQFANEFVPEEFFTGKRQNNP